MLDPSEHANVLLVAVIVVNGTLDLLERVVRWLGKNLDLDLLKGFGGRVRWLRRIDGGCLGRKVVRLGAVGIGVGVGVGRGLDGWG